jgi:glycosyltransferase involved in cell wall biosynthesis
MKIAILTTDNREPFREYHQPQPWFGTAPEALLQGFAELPEAEVHVISCTQKPMISSPEKLAGNIFFHSLHAPKIGWMRTLYQGCVRATRRKLRELQPDIVHGQGTERECALGAVFSGFPNVLTIHGNMAELARLFKARVGGYGWLAGKLENFALRRTAGVFCNSAYTEGLVHPRTEKTWRVPNALRAEFFGPQRQPPAARCQLLNIGVISPRKRQLELLAMVEQLRSTGMEFHFRFIGQAPANNDYTRAFLEKIRPLQVAGVASHVAPMGTGELISEFDRCHAVVHFPTEEAFGLVAAESLARGCKFFGSRAGGIVDITVGVAGTELYEVNDWAGLVSGITSWMRGGFGRSKDSVRQMQDRYSPLVIARRHLEIYREVLGRPL